ncbi:MAG: primosomal protein N', partial [Alphaproteobacteria bacterium]
MSVLLPVPIARPYDYAVPDDLALAPGAVVRVPLGGREAIGVVWDPPPVADEVPAARLRAVLERCDVPPLTAVQRRFIDWVADYTMAPRGAVLRMALSVPAALSPPRPRLGYRLAAGNAPGGLRLTAARQRVLAVLGAQPRPMADIVAAAGVGAAVVKGLVRAGVVPVSEK